MNGLSEIRLSVLDTGILTEGKSSRDAIEESRIMAITLEKAGYHRYWLGEHHEAHFSWTNPNMMVPYLGTQTEKIRLGTAAILMGLYPALQLAEDYRTMESMFPGRIDFGVCAGAPSCDDSRIALLNGKELNVPQVAGIFEERIAEMHKYLHNEFPDGHRFAYGATPLAQPGNGTWVMGSGFGSAVIAAKHSCSYSYSLFHRRSSRNPEVVAKYLEDFEVSPYRTSPENNIAISVICAEDRNEAFEQKKWVESIQSDFQVNVCGTPEECSEQIRQLCNEYHTQEAVIYMMWHVIEKRLKGFEAISDLLLAKRVSAV